MANETTNAKKSVQASVLDSPQWRLIGPHRGGRVVAVAGDPTDRRVFYFGACAGGVWKTADGGVSWLNISDGYFTSSAVGAITVSAADPNLIYVGTGETSIRGNVVAGDGVYKSVDAGRSWRNVGLADTRHIGKILIHPANPEIVYVAALGHAYGPNEERGVYRTTDGGKSWEKILYKSERAGSHDIAMDPHNPSILFASIWQAQRYPHTLISGGEECGLWRSLDGGDSWEEISGKPGLPAGLLGKIGVAASPAQRGRVWALVEAEDGALFRSDDFGEHWQRLSEEPLLRTRPWYYMHVTADTADPDTVYVQNYGFWKSIDGGATVRTIPTPHGDEHALWIDPHDNQRMIDGNDGGACVSYNGGASWSSIYNQPTAQLYHVATDDQVPYRVYGSQQDNTALSIPSMSIDGAIHERDWYAPGGGESGYIAVKPDDPNIVIASGPAGRRNYNDIMTLYDRRTGQRWNNTVWPELYGWGAGAESLKYRLQWTFPIMFSQHDPNVVYVAGNRLFRSTNLGASWEAVSGDLTRNDPEKLTPAGGPITRDNTGAEVYCTIFALAESPQQPGLLWAGTDDGLVHISENGGRNWEAITPEGLPEWSLISIIAPSPHDPGRAYLAATAYKLDDTRPYLYKTEDYGSSWQLITNGSNGIPADDFTRVIREDPQQPRLLYAGTESGLYVSFNDGESWQRLGGDFPVVPVHDLAVKGDELVVATHGRSFWILDDLNPLRELADGQVAGGQPHLFPPRARMRLRIYGGFGRAPQVGQTSYGHANTSVVSQTAAVGRDGAIRPLLLDAGQNPPDGAVITYYLPEAVDGARLEILDQKGNVLRSFDINTGLTPAAGVHHVLWNLRLPGATPVAAEGLTSWNRPDGPMVLPGEYRARLSIGEQQLETSFTIEPDPRIRASRDELQAQCDFLIEIRDSLSLNNELINQTSNLLAQARYWETRADAGRDVAEAAGALADELETIRAALIDVHIAGSQLWPSGLHEKLNALFDSVDSADYAPPQQARDVYAELSSQLVGCQERFEQAKARLAAELNQAIAAAGLPVVG